MKQIYTHIFMTQLNIVLLNRFTLLVYEHSLWLVYGFFETQFVFITVFCSPDIVPTKPC